MSAHNQIPKFPVVASGATATVLGYDETGNAILAFGSAPPSDASTGYATGCIFIHTDGTNKTALYVNEGSSSSADFNPALVQTEASALTAAKTVVTHTAPGTPDFAIQDLINTNAYGFVAKDEGNSVLQVIANLQTRQNEIETALQAAGIIA